MKKLIILVGLPGSGKSTYAKEIVNSNNRAVIVSSDDIREEFDNVHNLEHDEDVFKTFHKRIRNHLMNCSYDIVIADACHITLERRLETAKDAEGIDCLIEIKYIHTDLRTCIERSRKRVGKVIPDDVIFRMYSKLEAPIDNDGFRKE